MTHHGETSAVLSVGPCSLGDTLESACVPVPFELALGMAAHMPPAACFVLGTRALLLVVTPLP
eukprot:1158488-Pelagomonas_calceolata.AAC.6